MSKVGVVGGTGKEGRGLAVRWAMAGHHVTIGSRDAERGASKATELSAKHGVALAGGDNKAAIADADIVVLSVPHSAHRATLEQLKRELAGKVIIDLTVPLSPPKVFEVHLPESQAAALETREILGAGAKVTAALHHVSSVHLNATEHDLPTDVMVCGDHDDAKAAAMALIGDLGVRAIDAGPLCNAIALESLTPVLIYINKRYKSRSAGIRITGILE